MIKVIQFIYGLKCGGAESLVRDYALHLDKSLFDVTVICVERHNTGNEQALVDNGVKLIFLQDEIERICGNGLFAKANRKIAPYKIMRRLVKEIQPDVIHYHLTVGRFLLTAGISSKCRMVYTLHNTVEGIWFNGDRKAKIDFFVTKHFIRRRGMTVITLHDEMQIKVKELFKTDKVVVLNNGVDFEKFNIAETKEIIRDSLGIPLDAFVVGHIGRFSKQKNHDFLVDIFAELKKKEEKNCFLVMIGGNGPNQPEVEQKLEVYGIKDSAIILRNRSDIPRLLKMMDAFVFPSLYEGLGIALIEAQVARLVCAVSDAIPEKAIVSNYVRRLPLSLGADKWADEITDFYDNHEEFVSNGLENWDMKVVCKLLGDIYLDRFNG